MLSEEENALFTRVGPGTPVGSFLRRYWHAVGCSELVTAKPQRVKVLGEELLLYRAGDGAPVLMELRCAHRRVALDYGRVEGDCIRCPYHGWLYDRTGQCVEQPAEPEGSTFKDKVKLAGYRTQEFGGLVFGYLGPEPAPLLPLFDLLFKTEGVKEILQQPVYTSWFNHVENMVDISHLAWLHGYTFPAYGARKLSYHWERKPYGVDNVMRVEGIDDPHVSCYGFPTINRFALPPVEPERPDRLGDDLSRADGRRLDSAVLRALLSERYADVPGPYARAEVRRVRAPAQRLVGDRRARPGPHGDRAARRDRRSDQGATGRDGRRNHPVAPDDSRIAGRDRGRRRPAVPHSRSGAASGELSAEVGCDRRAHRRCGLFDGRRRHEDALVRSLSRAAAVRALGGAAVAPLLGAPAFGQAALPTVRVALIPIEPSCLVYYAQENGDFQRAGITVEVTENPASPAIASAVAAGSYDIGYATVSTLADAHAKGLPFVIVAPDGLIKPGVAVGAIVVAPQSSIHTAKDFDGKTCGVSAAEHALRIRSARLGRQARR